MSLRTQSITITRTVVVCCALVTAAVLAHVLQPKVNAEAAPAKLEQVIPSRFGDWQELPTRALQVDVALNANEATRDRPYDDLLSRTYTDGRGAQIMLALAYGSKQRQEVKIHRPELCYPAQGLAVLQLAPVTFQIPSLNHTPVTGQRMVAQAGPGAVELVSYWIRIGSTYSDSPWLTRYTIIREGLAGKMTDGILVRVSQRVAVNANYEPYFQSQEKFLADLVSATPHDGRNLLIR